MLPFRVAEAGKIGVFVPKKAHRLNRENGRGEFHTLILGVDGDLEAAETAGLVRTVFFAGVLTARLAARGFWPVAFFSGRVLDSSCDTAVSRLPVRIFVLRCFDCGDSRPTPEDRFTARAPRLSLMIPSG